MKALSTAVARVSTELHPETIDVLCLAIRDCKSSTVLSRIKASLGANFAPSLLQELQLGLQSTPDITGRELSAMFAASSATSALITSGCSLELVWTGPATGLVPVRKTEQVLVGLIEEARSRLFVVSFVAYNISRVVDVLRVASKRGVQLNFLVERSKEHGGSVTIDSIMMFKRELPLARIYEWDRSQSPVDSLAASVHAKCAVADGNVAFVTSANLTEAAMERNMELGLLVRGGHTPKLLDEHLSALVTTKQLRAL